MDQLPHIRKFGRARFTETECGAPVSKNDVRASAWLKPFRKCPDCSEAIRIRMARVAAVNRPLAADGLISYRCRNRYGWTMIGAIDHDDAMREARRSDETAKREDLQIWNGSEYVAFLPLAT